MLQRSYSRIGARLSSSHLLSVSRQFSTVNHYAVLGLPRDADEAAIKQAHRQLALRHHPDQGGNPANFRLVQEAYEALTKKPDFSQGENFRKSSRYSRPPEGESFPEDSFSSLEKVIILGAYFGMVGTAAYLGYSLFNGARHKVKTMIGMTDEKVNESSSQNKLK